MEFEAEAESKMGSDVNDGVLIVDAEEEQLEVSENKALHDGVECKTSSETPPTM